MERGDILLCDLDAFYASVEQLDNPELQGKPVIVGGDLDERGVVSTCSYEARAFGVKSAMPVKIAKGLCPSGIFLPVNMARYLEMSHKVIDIYLRYTPEIEVVSVDEAYLEVQRGKGTLVAGKIRTAVKEELGLTVSIGVSSNKLLAKICSNLAKPDGMRKLWPEEATRVLGDYSVRIIPGIGPKTTAKLMGYGINTVAELSSYSLDWFREFFGLRGVELYKFVHWEDDRPLVLDQKPKSMGEEITFPEDISDKDQAISVFKNLSAKVGYRLRRSGYHARTLTIKVRYSDFKTVTRSITLDYLLYTDGDIYKIAINLFNTLNNKQPIRLLGIQVASFEKDVQLSLFSEKENKQIKLADLIDELNNKYGIKVICRGCSGPNLFINEEG